MTKARDIASAAPAPSTVSATEIGYLDGVTSAIQTQIDGKASTTADIPKSLIDAKGDLIVGSANDTAARLAVGTNDHVLTADSSATNGVKWAALPAATQTFVGASMYKGSFQSLSNGVWTAITFSNEFFDTDAYHDNSTNTSRMTIPTGKGGKYLIAGMIDWSSGTSSREIALYKNGNTERFLSKVMITTSSTWQQNFVTVINLVAGDYIEIYGNVSGVGFSVDGGTDRTQVAITYLGA